MANPHKTYEIRCPVHGFIRLNDWEWDVISQPAFQRLRRIRQLAWTDYVYPGAMHTRFEHSLGVMHAATMLYDSIVNNSRELLESELAYNAAGFERDRQLVRFAALLHDVGHAPFSHAAEELFPAKDAGQKYVHEDYSVAIIEAGLRGAIEEHPLNSNYNLRAEEITALIKGGSSARKTVFWRDLITSQMDADRMDYLLRDSYHAGVQYGRFDLHRLINTIRAIPFKDKDPRLGISEGGIHAAEGLVLARYFMFTQVYFHKTRVAYDVHLRTAMKQLLPNGQFPRPVGAELVEFLGWEDWKVLGLLNGGGGGDDGERIRSRNHFRQVFHTPEAPGADDIEQLQKVKTKLGSLMVAEEHAEKSWYKTGPLDIPVLSDIGKNLVSPLSKHSRVVGSMQPNNQVFLYVKPEDVAKAKQIVDEVLKQ
ncbi:MAG TPA: HD domain-containing protein [Candidatus Angelobacter sp.]|nr:HD domain-containing protein [Candidatus Angelobacter sp.]